jgi:hypothetical protein
MNAFQEDFPVHLRTTEIKQIKKEAQKTFEQEPENMSDDLSIFGVVPSELNKFDSDHYSSMLG